MSIIIINNDDNNNNNNNNNKKKKKNKKKNKKKKNDKCNWVTELKRIIQSTPFAFLSVKNINNSTN